MKRFLLFFAVNVLACSLALAQESARGSASARGKAKAEAQTADQAIILDSGTQLSAELLAAIEAGKAKPGDEFKLRTLKPVTVGGKELIAKGSTLTGRVVESARAEGKGGVSRLKLSFDQLRNKNLTAPFSATIEQITQVSISSQSQIGDLGAPTEAVGAGARSRPAASGRSNGGLLGGVTGAVNNTVGGVVGATTDAVGGVVDTTSQAAGNVIAASSQTVNGAAANAKGLIAITSTSGVEASGSSTLTLTGKNMRIEKGSVFHLRTDKSLNINASKAPNR